jgi:hypothetical protein
LQSGERRKIVEK